MVETKNNHFRTRYLEVEVAPGAKEKLDSRSSATSSATAIPAATRGRERWTRGRGTVDAKVLADHAAF